MASSLLRACESESAPEPGPEAAAKVEPTAVATLTLPASKGNLGISFEWPRVASVTPGGLAHAAGVRAGHACHTVGGVAAAAYDNAAAAYGDATAAYGDRPVSVTFVAEKNATTPRSDREEEKGEVTGRVAMRVTSGSTSGLAACKRCGQLIEKTMASVWLPKAQVESACSRMFSAIAV